jgi:3'-phosphoadenosine 5'-phosphosulfate sulfotransferase (PAPS reductase)/FAD synthetase
MGSLNRINAMSKSGWAVQLGDDKPKYDLMRMAMPEEQVQSLDKNKRLERMHLLIQEAHELLDFGIKTMITDEKKRVAAICVLYSGGNDSTCLAHLFKDKADYAVHANTTIGIEQTRQFVRDTCKQWELPLLEYVPPPGSTYRELILEDGFPGPGMHWKMYQRLKERCLRQARSELVKKPRQERVVFLSGRRRTESARRASVPELTRTRSMVWISPLVNWTKTDLYTYRDWAGDVPRNEVSDLIHMSGECLCGAFAHKDELSEIEAFFPEVAVEIRKLEEEVAATGKHPPKVCKWGWGATQKLTADDLKSGPLCSSCEYRQETLFEEQERTH